MKTRTCKSMVSRVVYLMEVACVAFTPASPDFLRPTPDSPGEGLGARVFDR